MGFDIGKFASTLSSNRPRTIEVVTEEAKEAKAQITTGFLDLGARLNEAKEMLPHGEWLPWLNREMQFSERTAQKFMALAREYEGNPKLAADLGSEKAFALLALPKEEREQIAAEGATVNGKTKPATDLTTREVKQIVAERKEPGYAERAAQAYLEQRAEENERFNQLLYRFRNEFFTALAVCESRQDGIFILKERFKYSASGSSSGGWSGSPKGLGLHGGDFHSIVRTWAEVWDMLAVMALQETGLKPAEPEGQLAIAGWMPGGTNPGAESGWCVVILDYGAGPRPKGVWWDGVLSRWLFHSNGETIGLEPLAWMRLPEWGG